MKITIHSTDRLVNMRQPGGQAVPARVWEGTTESGIPVFAFMTQIAPLIPAPIQADTIETFTRELQEHSKGTWELEAIPPSMIL